MKKLLLLLFICPILIACSDEDNNGEEGYLTSLENVKTGIIGVWRTTVGGVYYSSYNADGTINNGFEPNGNWENSTTYGILKSGSDYILKIYVIGSSSGNYTDWKITVLDESNLTVNEIGGSRRVSTLTRVK